MAAAALLSNNPPYIYDRDGHLIADANGATGATTREYIWLPANDNTSGSGNDNYAEATGLASNDNAPPDLLLAAVYNVGQANQFMHYIHSDHLGRPIRSTDAAKATARNVTYKPWGEQIALPSGPTGGSILLQRAPGQYWQIETDLFYNWHRHYDYWSGRYLQPDPLGLAPGMNRYAYANNSPFMRTDRDGRTDYSYPFNGRIRNDSSSPMTAGGGKGDEWRSERIDPGKSGSGWYSMDWDFAWINCVCYKLSWGRTVVTDDSRFTPVPFPYGPFQKYTDPYFCGLTKRPTECRLCALGTR